MGISEQELEHIKELLFTGDKGNIKLVDVLLEQRVKFSQLDDFYKYRIYPPALGFVSVYTAGFLNKRCIFVSHTWDYTRFFELLQTYARELAFVHAKEIFKGVLDFNLKCQKCKLIYFPSEVSEEFVSLVKEKRPDIEVEIDK
jgi:hypothetical protein